jgi:hypothetical protein
MPSYWCRKSPAVMCRSVRTWRPKLCGELNSRWYATFAMEKPEFSNNRAARTRRAMAR